MSGVIAALLGTGLVILDTQTVTTGTLGTLPNRFRGFSVSSFGSITDGTSNIYSGGAIQQLYWDESAATYVLGIVGSVNSGWDSVIIGAKRFNRSSASFATNTWTWTTPDGILAQEFGAASSVITVTFS